jgi:subtilisin-like proprotein convertase family protein
MNESILSRTLLTLLLSTLMGSVMAEQFVGNQSNVPIPDNGCGSNELVIEIEVSQMGRLNFAEKKNLVVFFSIEHPFAADIQMTLTSPSGTEVLLVSSNGSGGDNFGGTLLVPWSGAGSISAGSAPFLSAYQPLEPLSTFDGEVADGIWRLTVCDDASSDVGTFVTAELIFNFLSLTERLAALYRLEGTLQDEAGEGMGPLGTNGSGGFNPDPYLRPSGSYGFNGTNKLTATTDINLMNPTSAFTIAAWVRASNIVSDQKIVGKATDNVETLFTLGVENGSFHFATKINGVSGPGGTKLIGGAPLVANQWYHVAGTWTQDGTKRLYINGSEVASEAVANTPFASLASSSLTIGGAPWANTLRLTGAVDEVRFYSYALTDWGIKDIAQGRNNFCQGAIDLPVDGTSCTDPRLGHNFSGSTTGLSAACGSYGGGDLWYQVTVPASGNLTAESSTQPGSRISDMVMELYSGPCDNLVSVECQDDNGSERMPSISVSNRTPGEVLYVRLFEYGNNDFGFFQACGYSSAATSVADAPSLDQVTLFPNPTEAGVSTLRYHELPAGSQVQVLDPTGRLLLQQSLAGPNGEMALDLAQQAPGVYLVVIQGANTRLTRKLILR